MLQVPCCKPLAPDDLASAYLVAITAIHFIGTDQAVVYLLVSQRVRAHAPRRKKEIQRPDF